MDACASLIGRATVVGTAASNVSGTTTFNVHHDYVGSSLLAETEGGNVDGSSRTVSVSRLDELAQSHLSAGSLPGEDRCPRRGARGTRGITGDSQERHRCGCRSVFPGLLRRWCRIRPSGCAHERPRVRGARCVRPDAPTRGWISCTSRSSVRTQRLTRARDPWLRHTGPAQPARPAVSGRVPEALGGGRPFHFSLVRRVIAKDARRHASSKRSAGYVVGDDRAGANDHVVS